MSIKWISHRGLSLHHDENTRISFELACDAGFTCLETDLHTTKDNHIVLCHDAELNKLSACTGNIIDMSRAELEKIQLNQGEKLLFLDEFMLLFQQQNWVFDIKPASSIATIKLLNTLYRSNRELLNKTIFLFWNAEDQCIFLDDFPEAICFPRGYECYRAGIATLSGLAMLGGIKSNKIYSVTPKLLGVPVLNSRIVQKFHSYGAQVLGYLPETNEETQLCLDAEVDYILTNHRPVAAI